MKRQLISRVLRTFCVVAAAYILISRAWNTYLSTRAVSGYGSTVGAESRESLDAAFRAAQNYNREFFSGGPTDGYEDLLNLSGDGIMGSIEIPAIGIRLPVYHGTSPEVLEEGCGHLKDSSLPVGGPSTHAVITGHRGLPDSKMFTDLNHLRKGDTFVLSVLGRKLTYRVDQILTVSPDDLDALAIEKDHDYVTLVTCTPYGVNTERLLVRGERADDTAGADSVPGGARGLAEKILRFLLRPEVTYALGAAALVAGIFLFRRIWRHGRD